MSVADNASTISLSGSSQWICQQCDVVLKKAQARESHLKEELDAARKLTERYATELAAAMQTLNSIRKSSSDAEEHISASLTAIVEEKRKRFHQQSSSTDESQQRSTDANVFSRRRSSEGCAPVPVLSLHPEAPPSYEEKKWWKGDGASQSCPRGCDHIEESRREHYKKWHYNVYYAFVNREDNYSERERWMCTLFGDKVPGIRVCHYCHHLLKKDSKHNGQLQLANHIENEHPEVFGELAVQHSRHRSNTAATSHIPQLPGEIDRLLEKSLNGTHEKDKIHEQLH
ncbi:hypothetical protein PENTCL1PPCAC_29755 [Pristionchus entomophagus]|uniref:BED-type domain-containing protein n=1 Tax=Pristionchus entomophagus TaxID=358040 RepID=A0AAV5UMD8_9BILA|nr:hypothetical protein PENTCL1PPCAC_29755 [Pristionchus entomophagus]